MQSTEKLRVFWSKKTKDLILWHPFGVGTKSDAHWLAGVFNEDFTNELEKRGYNISTLKFSVEPKKGEKKFASQR